MIKVQAMLMLSNFLDFSLANVTFNEVSIFVQVLTERLYFCIVDMFQVLEVLRKARFLCACSTIFVVTLYARTVCTECRVFDVVRRPAATLHSGSTAAAFLGLQLRRSSLSKTTSTKLDARIPGLHRCRSPT
uniref:Putative secreted protein n=1 Tax=Ixodes ricinus TaxID=34613 RepID=A0A6B0URB2_IXORI